VIDFRYHLVSIIAVLLALATGLLLGSTTLQGSAFGALDHSSAAASRQAQQLREQATTLQGQLARGQAFDAAVLPTALAGRLAGQSVVVVSAPGADSSIRNALTRALLAAGATVSADVRMLPAYLDPAQDPLLADLAARLAGRTLLAAGTGADQAAQVLAGVLVTRPSIAGPSAGSVATVLNAFSDAGMLSMVGSNPRPGTMAIVLAAAKPTADPTTSASANAALLALAAELQTHGLGTIVAGPEAAANAPGTVAAARGDATLSHTVSTVDTVESPEGQIAAVLALVAEMGGHSGSYGPAGSAPLPGFAR